MTRPQRGSGRRWASWCWRRATGALTVIFGLQETSDFWVDGLKLWWGLVKDRCHSIRRLVIYLDNGPNNSGTRTQFIRRMVEFADWSGLEIRLVYYPPYHSKYNPIERCWSILEQKWGGALLNCLKVIGGPADDLEGLPPNRQALGGRLPGRYPSYEERDEALRGATATIRNASQIRHHNQTARQVNHFLPLA